MTMYELEVPTTARYIRYKNIDVPTPNLAISELRVFGLGFGKAPRSPQKLALDRHTDRRDVTVRWEPVKGAQGYNVLWGIALISYTVRGWCTVAMSWR